MKLSKLTKPELEEIFRNANFTEEEEKEIRPSIPTLSLIHI